MSELSVPLAYQWLLALTERFPNEAKDFSCCFEHVDSPDPCAWVMVGRFANITCDVRQDAVITRLELGDHLVSRQVAPIDAADLPYTTLFSALAAALRMARNVLRPSRLGEVPTLRWFGGWKHVRKSQDADAAALFILPQLALRLDARGVQVFNWGALDVSAIAAVLQSTKGTPSAQRPPARELRRELLVPSRSDYFAAAEQVLSAVAAHEYEKVVLARKRIFEFCDALDPIDIYRRLIENRGHAFQYLVAFDEREAWVGISPELLLQRSGNEIATRPLAGSRRRGTSATNDARELHSLMASDKDGREHELAAQHMFRRLGAICERNSLQMTAVKQLSKLNYIQHLASEMKGRLERPFDAVDALARIYPPATILGLPEFAADRLLARCEPFDREFFSGGIGFLASNGDCDIALCIRTARVSSNELHVYAGSGYVDGSVAEDEWCETEVKMQPFCKLVRDLTATSQH